MISTSRSGAGIAPVADKADAYPAGGLRFDLLVIAAACWFTFGLYLDGWAHDQPGLVDSFFTPWHGVLYSGYLAVAAVIGGYQVRNMLQGHRLTRALPKGYWPSLIGIGLFASGGGFDMVWHTLFGFEGNIQALLSPAHLFLATGATLFTSGPLRATWERTRLAPQRGWRQLLPAMMALLLLYSGLSFFTMYAHPFGSPQLLAGQIEGVRQYFIDIQGILGTLVPSALLIGVLLLGMRSWRLPFGTVTLILGGNMAMMYLIRIRNARDFLPIAVVTVAVALLADCALLGLRPSFKRVAQLRAFCFGLPFAWFAATYATFIETSGLKWTIHMWLGASVLAGVTGLFLSYLAVPPLRDIPVYEGE